jgi:hypothetical protein
MHRVPSSCEHRAHGFTVMKKGQHHGASSGGRLWSAHRLRAASIPHPPLLPRRNSTSIDAQREPGEAFIAGFVFAFTRGVRQDKLIRWYGRVAPK